MTSLFAFSIEMGHCCWSYYSRTLLISNSHQASHSKFDNISYELITVFAEVLGRSVISTFIKQTNTLVLIVNSIIIISINYVLESYS